MVYACGSYIERFCLLAQGGHATKGSVPTHSRNGYGV